MLCPTCGKPFERETAPAMPFCSARCKAVDLGRWLDEKFTLPVVKSPLDEPDELPPEAP